MAELYLGIVLEQKDGTCSCTSVPTHSRKCSKYSIPLNQVETIFRSFIEVNIASAWEEKLQSAFTMVYLRGFLTPNCLLVAAKKAKCLKMIKNFWTRRLLHNPKGFRIQGVYEVKPFEYVPVNQNSFIPLADAICSIISKCRNKKETCRLEDIKRHLEAEYAEFPSPPDDVLHRVLATLLSTKKIVCLEGTGYAIKSTRQEENVPSCSKTGQQQQQQQQHHHHHHQNKNNNQHQHQQHQQPEPHGRNPQDVLKEKKPEIVKETEQVEEPVKLRRTRSLLESVRKDVQSEEKENFCFNPEDAHIKVRPFVSLGKFLHTVRVRSKLLAAGEVNSEKCNLATQFPSEETGWTEKKVSCCEEEISHDSPKSDSGIAEQRSHEEGSLLAGEKYEDVKYAKASSPNYRETNLDEISYIDEDREQALTATAVTHYMCI